MMISGMEKMQMKRKRGDWASCYTHFDLLLLLKCTRKEKFRANAGKAGRSTKERKKEEKKK